MYERKYAVKVLATQKDPPRTKAPRHPFPLKQFLWGLGIAALLAGVVVALRHPALQVHEILVEGNETIDPEDVAVFIREEMQGTVLHIFPRTSIFIISTSTLEREIGQQFPRIANVQVRHKGVDGLSVKIAEHTEKYLWCASSEQCFFMTEEGIVFAEAPFFSGDAYERIFWGQKAPALPFSPVPAEILALLSVFRDRLPSLGIVPIEYHFVSDYRTDIHFFHHGSEATLIIDPTLPPEQVIGGLSAALAAEPLQKEFTGSAKVLDYLDARFPNKVIYKFKN